MVSIFILSGLSQKILQEILILKTNANLKKSVAFPPHLQSWGKQRLSDFLSSSLKQKDRVKEQEAITQMAIIKLIRLSNNCHQEVENRLMSIHY